MVNLDIWHESAEDRHDLEGNNSTEDLGTKAAEEEEPGRRVERASHSSTEIDVDHDQLDLTHNATPVRSLGIMRGTARTRKGAL